MMVSIYKIREARECEEKIESTRMRLENFVITLKSMPSCFFEYN